MGDIGDHWREHKEYLKKKRQKEGWESNQYKTSEARLRGIKNSEWCNNYEDEKTINTLEELSIKFEKKNVHSFMLEFSWGNAMLYTGKKGDRLHIINGAKYELDYLKSGLKAFIAGPELLNNK